MATHEYDAVIIGSGHNGLIVGNYLAMAGLSVCVLEANDMIGGCTTTVECTLPGFKHDIGSVALGAISRILSTPMTSWASARSTVLNSSTRRRTVPPSIPMAPVSWRMATWPTSSRRSPLIRPEDAQAYGQFIQEKARLLPLISTGMSTCPPPMGLFVNQLNSTPEGRDLFQIHVHVRPCRWLASGSSIPRRSPMC